MITIQPYDDTTILTWGKHYGKALANVPASWLLWAYKNTDLQSDMFLKEYIENNMQLLEQQANDEKRDFFNSKR